jgi:hypothetical protein
MFTKLHCSVHAVAVPPRRVVQTSDTPFHAATSVGVPLYVTNGSPHMKCLAAGNEIALKVGDTPLQGRRYRTVPAM